MTLETIVAGIAWDPEIRGVLTVAVGVAVLMGSVYLLLATNVAHRLGFLLALAAFFGWMIIHGLVWWIYPPIMGPAGRAPSWEVQEINRNDLSAALNEEVHGIDTSRLPDPEVVDEATTDELDGLLADVREDLDGWTLLPAADPGRAEAQATAQALLVDEGVVPEISEQDDFVFHYVLETGGKPERKSDSMFDRVANTITNSLRLTHPPHYMVVQVQPTIEQEEVAGQPPPTPEADPDADIISLVMVRDIGQRRVPAALITLGSALIFGLLCAMLHQRDKRVAENRSAPLPATTVSSNGG